MTDHPRILVVDDDPVWFEHYFSELRWDGFVMDYANSIGEALRRLEETEYDAAVLDYYFRHEPEPSSPGTVDHRLHDGIDLATHIRETWPSMVVIVASQAINAWGRERFDFFREKGILVTQKRDFSPSRMRQFVRSSLDASRLRVFIVHGRDHETLQDLVDGLHALGIRDVIILKDMPGSGLTLIEKFERYVDDIDVALVLCTPDDIGGLREKATQTTPRSRQNIVFEMGYFIGRLGRARQRVILLVTQPLEFPSDISGVAYVDISRGVAGVLDEIRREIEYGLLPNKPDAADRLVAAADPRRSARADQAQTNTDVMKRNPEPKPSVVEPLVGLFSPPLVAFEVSS